MVDAILPFYEDAARLWLLILRACGMDIKKVESDSWCLSLETMNIAR